MLLLSKLLLRNYLIWVLLHLISQDNLLFSINFSNGIKIVKTLVPLLLLHTSTSFASLTHSNSLGPIGLDSVVTYHIIGNKSFFSSLSTSSYLPFVTMTNGYRVSSHGVDTIHPLFLSIDNVFISLGLHLTYYPLVISRVPLIVLFLLPKILFVYRSGVQVLCLH